MLMKSKTGEVLDKTEWFNELNKFWKIFEDFSKCNVISKNFPKRPCDAWERYVKVMGLEIV